MKRVLPTIVAILLSPLAFAQTTQPATRPATQPAPMTDPDLMLKQLLTPSRPNVKPLQPAPDPPAIDVGARTAVAPNAPLTQLIREGTYLFNRAGRLTRTPDGQHEFIFESDGQAMKDPPMLVLPNLTLMAMENAIKTSGRDRFRITGMVTEYGARNHILLDKAVVIPEK